MYRRRGNRRCGRWFCGMRGRRSSSALQLSAIRNRSTPLDLDVERARLIARRADLDSVQASLEFELAADIFGRADIVAIDVELQQSFRLEVETQTPGLRHRLSIGG